MESKVLLFCLFATGSCLLCYYYLSDIVSIFGIYFQEVNTRAHPFAQNCPFVTEGSKNLSSYQFAKNIIHFDAVNGYRRVDREGCSYRVGKNL